MKKKSNIFVKKILLSTIVGVVAIGILSFCIFQNITMAASYSNDALVTSVLRCVNYKQFESKVELKDFNKNYATTYAKTSIFMSGSQKVWVPLGFSGDGKDATLEMECREVVAKALSNKGVNIPDASSTNTKRAEFLKSLGYKGQGSGQSKTCFRFKYTMYADKKSNEPLGDALTQAICAHIENGKFVDTDVIIQPGNSEVLKHYVSFDYSKSVLEVELWGLGNNVDISVAKGDSWGDFKNNVKNAILGKWPHVWACSSEDGVGCENEMQYRYYDIFKNKGNSSSGANIEEFPDGEDSSSTYTLTVDDSSKKLITGTLTGGSISTYPTISNDDTFNMYQSYLKKYYEADIKCGVSEDWLNSADAKDYNEITSCSADGKTQTCYAKAMANNNNNVGGIDTNQHFGVDCDFACVARWLSNYDKVSDTCPKAEEEPEPTPDEPEDTSKFDCDQLIEQNTNGEGIGAMQWLLCPSLNNTAYTADWLDRLTKDLLEVNPDMYTGLGEAWGSIRNIANVIIIIFLLIVIFSQLTGYGIDNYGIKKMLPRIITMAIVINLSLYICQIVIDLSNILGVGLRDVFGTLAGSTSNDSSYVISALLGIFAAAPTVGGAVIAGLAFGGWVAVVIGLVVLVLVIVVALVTFFVMLGARDVIIIFCVIISPLAFAAFILPNTQSLFKKWWDLFKAAIIIFPLCGAASGISASLRQLDADGKLGDLGVGGKLIMLVLPYLVFFLLPMLLKQAISGLGKLGGALSSLGNTVRNGGRAIGQGAMRGVQGSERFKDWQNYRQQQAAAKRAQRTYDKLNPNRSNLNARQQDRLKKAQDILAAQRLREAENQAQTRDEKYFHGTVAKQNLSTNEAARDTMVYSDANYVTGKETAGRLNRENEVANTKLYNDTDFVLGKEALQQLGVENNLEGTRLYTTPGLIDSKREQFTAQRHGELRKMYSERFTNMNAAEKQKELIDALKGNDAAAVERMDAAFEALMATGDKREILDAISSADFANMDANIRDRSLQKMGGSGDVIMKGFAKSGATNNFSDYVSSGGLKRYFDNELGEHGLDNATKEDFEFLAKDGMRAAAINNDMIANASVTAANQNQRSARAIADIISMSDKRRNEVGAKISAKGLTNMNQTIAEAYGPTALAPAIAEITKQGNEQLLAGVNDPVRVALGLPNSTTPQTQASHSPNFNDENGGD